MLKRFIGLSRQLTLALLATAAPLLAQSRQDLTFSPQQNPWNTVQRATRLVDRRDSASAAILLCPIAAFGEEKGSGLNTADDLNDSSVQIIRHNPPRDRNQNIYYRNKLEFSLEGGWLPINIPFPFDFLLGSGYNFPGLYYTLVPVMASVRWQFDDVGGPPILRGNWETSATLSVTFIPRGAETRYFSYIMGIRRNFVPRRWKAVPYLDGQLGMGNIDAKGPYGVKYAQGQNFTFTLNLGSGLRFNLNPRYSIEAGMHYMHISNLYLSEPKFLNYGINVYGPWAGVNIRIGKPRSADK